MTHRRHATAARRHAARGFTLIECCVAMSVAGVLATTAMPGLRSMLDQQRLRSASQALVSDMRLARDTALSLRRNVSLSVKPAADGVCYIVHTGAPGDCDCGDATHPGQCSGGDASAIKSVLLPAAGRVTLQANVASVAFDPDHGTTTPTGTFRVIGADGREIRQIVNIMGRIRACSPQGDVSGLRAC